MAEKPQATGDSPFTTRDPRSAIRDPRCALTRTLRASYAFVERNFNLVRRYWGWEAVWLAYSIATTLSITYIGAGMEAISGVQVDTNYLILYLLIGTMVWRFLAIIFDNISEMIAWERWEGTIEYTLMAPITRFTHMMGQTAFAVAYSLLFTLVILGVVVLFFQLDLSGANLWGATVMLLAGSLSFIGLGILASVLPLLFPERGAQMTNVLQAVFLLISGVYYPVEVLPAWMQALARVSPATFVLEGMRAAILRGAPTSSLWPYLWPALLAGVVSIPLGLTVFHQAERYAKQTGKLKRDG
ncbi:MAG: ABC transporter permease [Thermoflexales bacterium]|nr:ABC transporter permease [Thermoflexales bacterium]